MDACFIDLTLEFLSVAFHNILYYAAVYPASIFEKKKKYGVVVYQSVHPEINQYIELCLKSVSECIKSGNLDRIELAVTDSFYKPIIIFVFDLSKNNLFDETLDSYLIQCEQNLRAFCLTMSCSSCKLPKLPEDCSFSIFLHTNEAGAVSVASKTDLEDFPLVEVTEKSEEKSRIIPLRRFSIRSFTLDTFIEL